MSNLFNGTPQPEQMRETLGKRLQQAEEKLVSSRRGARALSNLRSGKADAGVADLLSGQVPGLKEFLQAENDARELDERIEVWHTDAPGGFLKPRECGHATDRACVACGLRQCGQCAPDKCSGCPSEKLRLDGAPPPPERKNPKMRNR